MKDLDFISGQFLEYDVPKEKRWLLHYFDNPLQLAFLRYYMIAGDWSNFVDHTGYFCCRSLLQRLEDRYRNLVSLHETARASMTEENMGTILRLESGKFNLTKLPKS